MKKARIVFDLDGTLIDSAPDIRGIANALLQAEGAEPISLEQTRSFIGNGVEVFVERMRDVRGLPRELQEPMTRAFVDRYHTAYHLTELYPGVRDVLETLHRDYELGICTNKVTAPCHAVLRHLGLDHLFGVVIGGDSLPTRKPDPAMLHAAFEALGGGGRIYVGDSEVDAETAQRAGVPFLLFSGGYRKSQVDDIPKTDHFDTFSELYKKIEQIVSR